MKLKWNIVFPSLIWFWSKSLAPNDPQPGNKHNKTHNMYMPATTLIVGTISPGIAIAQTISRANCLLTKHSQSLIKTNDFTKQEKEKKGKEEKESSLYLPTILRAG